MNADLATDDLVGLAHRLLAGLGDPELSPILAAWPAHGVGAVASLTAQPKACLPVLAWLPQLARAADGPTAPLVTSLARLADTLTWHQTYTEAQLGADFMQNYGYTEIIGLRAPQRSRDIACGFLLLGPHTHYPRHRHEAREIYVTLSGGARWLQGDEIWRERRPGAVIQHASEEIHAMQTGAVPLLAMYLWRSKNLDQKARLDADASLA
jgi:Dimethlysulfonioproprionate lyase